MIKNMIPGLPEYGKIKAGKKGEMVESSGGKKFRLPMKLDHYIITTTERNESGDLILDEDLMNSLKESKHTILNKDENIVGIPIKLLYNDISLNFPTRYACYVSNMCVCSGDGEWATTRDGRERECPCEQLDVGYQGKDKCKPNGKLYAIIDGAMNVGACHVLRTTSFNSVKSILGGLAFIQAASSGLLAFLPLHLILSPRAVTTPSGSQTTVYISSIIYRGNIDQLRQQALGMAKEKASYLLQMETVEDNARQLMEASVESDDEQAEVAEEFYPEGVDVKVEEPKVEKEKPKVKPKAKSKSKPKPATKVETVTESPETVTKSPDTITAHLSSFTESPDSTTDADGQSNPPEAITKDQKMQIVRLKKSNKITNPEVWAELLKPWDVKSANFLTFDQAEEFIKALNENPT